MMANFVLKVADRAVEINCLHESSEDYCKEYICNVEPDFSVVITSEDITFEREQITRKGLVEEASVSNAQLEITSIQRKIAQKLFDYNTLLLHGSAVAVDGQAYLFTAKSGTGKSTHTRLWREMLGNRAVMVNDDKPFLRVTGENILVCGSPWNGKHRLGTNICVPLKAICVLERGLENQIVRITAGEALVDLMQQTNRPVDVTLLPKYMELLDEIAGRTAFYRLRCNMAPQAAALSFQAMSGES